MPARQTDIVAGTLAGGVGGAFGAGIKVLCERIVPPRPPGREPPPGILADKLVRAIADDGLTEEQRARVSAIVHWIFSIATSAIYGACVEVWPAAKAGWGTGFGLVIWVGFHEITLPLLGATPPLAELPASEQVNEFITHAIFGGTVESVRAALRA
jgi:putative membrane protein